MQKCVESVGEFVVSGCDTTELLATIEKSFDIVSRLISMPDHFALGVAVAQRRDDDLSASRDCLDQGGALRSIGKLACRQDQTNWIAKGIDTCLDFGGQSAPRATDSPIANVLGQVSPRRSCTGEVQNRLNKQPVICRSTAFVGGFPGCKSAIRNHCSSFNIRRSMCKIQISGCKKSATVNSP